MRSVGWDLMMVGGEREGVSDCELGRVRAGRAAAFLPSALPPSRVDSIHFCTARKLYNQKKENKVFEIQQFFHIVHYCPQVCGLQHN